MNAKAPFLRSSCALVIAAGLAAPAFGQYRSMDGSGNNAAHPTWGQAGGDLMRLTAPAYADGFSAMSRPLGPNPRDVSNAVVAQSGSILNNRNMSDLVWQWGQFIDHDLDLSLDGSEAANISTSPTDPYFLGAPIFFNRSEFGPATGTTNPRQHLNVNSSYIDGSMIYGSAQARSALPGSPRLTGLGVYAITSSKAVVPPARRSR